MDVSELKRVINIQQKHIKSMLDNAHETFDISLQELNKLDDSYYDVKYAMLRIEQDKINCVENTYVANTTNEHKYNEITN